jgi:phosphomannomutase/phosphoglucomutase
MAKYVQDIRGVVNAEISNKFASHLGTIIGNYLGCEQYVLVGRDFYTPSQMIKRSITTGLMSSGINVMDFGIAPIPVIHSNMDFYDASVMISISKSHLRPEDINIKIISDHEIPLEQRPGEKVSWEKIGELNYVHDYQDRYINAVVEKAPSKLIKGKGFLMVLDCEEGIKKPFAPDILHKMGCQTILIGCKDTQFEDSFPEPNPQRISLVSELTTAIGADMGVILDNDRDMAVFIDEKGNRIRDQTILAIFTKYILKENPGSSVVSSVVVSKYLDEIMGNENKLIKTSINNVLSSVIEEKAVFGGDEPGMYVFPEFQVCFDAIFATIKMLEIMGKEDSPLSVLAKEIDEYPRTVFTIDCENEKKSQIINFFKNHFELNHEINTLDGIRVDLEDSFILIRPSRFEPLIRVYIESKSCPQLQKLTKSVKDMIEIV